MIDPRQKHWYAIQVKPRSEKKVAALLSARGVEEFLPLYSVRRKWSDRSKVVEFPLFPRYTFGRLVEQEQYVVAQVPGVRSIVSFGSRAAPLDDREIEAVRAMIDSHLVVTPCARFVQGQRVRVERGPLAGCEGVLDRFKGTQRLVVNVSLLRRSVAVEIDPAWVTTVGEMRFAGRLVNPGGWLSPRLRRGVV